MNKKGDFTIEQVAILLLIVVIIIILIVSSGYLDNALKGVLGLL